MSVQLPATFKELVDAGTVVVVGTTNGDGSPQTSVLWATYEGDDILLSTIEGRQKPRNWRNDPRTSVIVYDTANPMTYVEVRGNATLTIDETGLIDRLSHTYTGDRFTGDDGTNHVRLVVRITPEHVVTH